MDEAILKEAHPLMLHMSALGQRLDDLRMQPLNRVESEIELIKRDLFDAEQGLLDLLMRLQEAAVEDRAMRAGQWSFEHGGIFAGTRLDPILPASWVYIGGVFDRSKTNIDELFAKLNRDLPANGDRWLDGARDFKLLKFVRAALGRHPIFAPYDEWMNNELDHSDVAPFVMPTILVEAEQL